MPVEIVAIVLVAALAHAAWNALVKGDDDRLVTLGAANAVPVLLCIPPGLAPAHCGYYAFLISAYRFGGLSKVYPLARGLSPLIVAAGAFAFAGERLGPVALAGVAIACAGIASLSAGDATMRTDEHRRGVFFAVGTALFIAGYTVTDGMGVRLSGHTVSYVAWLAILDGLPMLLAAAVLRRAEFAHHLAVRAWKSAAGGALQLTAYGLVVWALSVAPMAAVSALRETSVLFAAIIGVKLLGEPLGARRIAAAAVGAAGGGVVWWGGVGGGDDRVGVSDGALPSEPRPRPHAGPRLTPVPHAVRLASGTA